MKFFEKDYWNKLFKSNKLSWDIGYASPAIVEYFEQITDKNAKILVAGAGKGYETEWLWNNNFKNTYYLDFAIEAIKSFKQRMPQFPDSNIIIEDFFEHNGQYDFIVEQTFFTSFHPKQRKNFVDKIHELLSSQGKYVGLFFTNDFGLSYPPFAATKKEYYELFAKKFEFKIFEIAYNSIKPRKGREFFFVMKKNT